MLENSYAEVYYDGRTPNHQNEGHNTPHPYSEGTNPKFYDRRDGEKLVWLDYPDGTRQKYNLLEGDKRLMEVYYMYPDASI